MSRRTTKRVGVAFKVEAELAELLNQLPNKSAFIRKAIVAQLVIACPLCQGKGTVPRAVRDHYAAVIQSNCHFPCVRCGDDLSLPSDPADLRPEDRERLEQFFRGGPLYCGVCYQAALLCKQCGWHIDKERIPEHVRSAHSEQN